MSSGVRRLVAPLPPHTARPRSPPYLRAASLSAPHTVVVTPLECQSKPSTQPNAWNQNGSLSRRSSSSGPASRTMRVEMAPAISTIRRKSQGGAEPVCRGRSAVLREDIPRLSAFPVWTRSHYSAAADIREVEGVGNGCQIYSRARPCLLPAQPNTLGPRLFVLLCHFRVSRLPGGNGDGANLGGEFAPSPLRALRWSSKLRISSGGIDEGLNARPKPPQ